MSNRSWFFASQGKQQGPYPEAQLREFIANGTVTAETLVWSEGMAGWQKAGDIPGLLAGASGLPPVPQRGGLSATGGTAAAWSWLYRQAGRYLVCLRDPGALQLRGIQ